MVSSSSSSSRPSVRFAIPGGAAPLLAVPPPSSSTKNRRTSRFGDVEDAPAPIRASSGVVVPPPLLLKRRTSRHGEVDEAPPVVAPSPVPESSSSSSSEGRLNAPRPASSYRNLNVDGALSEAATGSSSRGLVNTTSSLSSQHAEKDAVPDLSSSSSSSSSSSRFLLKRQPRVSTGINAISSSTVSEDPEKKERLRQIAIAESQSRNHAEQGLQHLGLSLKQRISESSARFISSISEDDDDDDEKEESSTPQKSNSSVLLQQLNPTLAVEHVEQLDALTNEIEDLQNALSGKTEQVMDLEEQLEAAAQFDTSQLEDLERKHQKEIKAMQETANKEADEWKTKYLALAQEKANMDHESEVAWKQERAALISSKGKSLVRILRLETTLDIHTKMWQEETFNLKEELRAKHKENEALEEKNLKIMKEKTALRMQEMILQEKLRSLTAQSVDMSQLARAVEGLQSRISKKNLDEETTSDDSNSKRGRNKRSSTVEDVAEKYFTRRNSNLAAGAVEASGEQAKLLEMMMEQQRKNKEPDSGWGLVRKYMFGEPAQPATTAIEDTGVDIVKSSQSTRFLVT